MYGMWTTLWFYHHVDTNTRAFARRAARSANEGFGGGVSRPTAGEIGLEHHPRVPQDGLPRHRSRQAVDRSLMDLANAPNGSGGHARGRAPSRSRFVFRRRLQPPTGSLRRSWSRRRDPRPDGGCASALTDARADGRPARREGQRSLRPTRPASRSQAPGVTNHPGSTSSMIDTDDQVNHLDADERRDQSTKPLDQQIAAQERRGIHRPVGDAAERRWDQGAGELRTAHRFPSRIAPSSPNTALPSEHSHDNVGVPCSPSCCGLHPVVGR